MGESGLNWRFVIPTNVYVVVAEWLRRWTRNPLGSARAGSNPADYVFFFFFFHSLSSHQQGVVLT